MLKWSGFDPGSTDPHEQPRESLAAILQRIQTLEDLVEQLEQRNTLELHVARENVEPEKSPGAAPPADETIPDIEAADAGRPFSFDEAWYLDRNPDVAHAVALGKLSSGWQHYSMHGYAEGRLPAPSQEPTRVDVPPLPT